MYFLPGPAFSVSLLQKIIDAASRAAIFRNCKVTCHGIEMDVFSCSQGSANSDTTLERTQKDWNSIRIMMLRTNFSHFIYQLLFVLWFSSDVGIVSNPSLDDLSEIMPVVSRSLQDILDYEGDVEEDLMLNFEESFKDFPKRCIN